MRHEKFIEKLPIHVHLMGEFNTSKLYVDGRLLRPDDSQQIRNHSPDGFKWGYGGSGPAQLALAILLLYVPAETAQLHYQDFKFGYIAGLPQRDIDVHINLRWVMSKILELGPFEAAKQTHQAI
jgi:hypothetical protein